MSGQGRPSHEPSLPRKAHARLIRCLSICFTYPLKARSKVRHAKIWGKAGRCRKNDQLRTRRHAKLAGNHISKVEQWDATLAIRSGYLGHSCGPCFHTGGSPPANIGKYCVGISTQVADSFTYTSDSSNFCVHHRRSTLSPRPMKSGT